MSESLQRFRARVRSGAFTGPTSGLLDGLAQTNLVVLPADWADDFAAFAEVNPRPCPVVDRTPPGDPHAPYAAPDADLRTDVPRYRVFVDGELVDEPTDVREWWRDDLAAFLLGCSFTFERALRNAGLPLRHVEQDRAVSMYVTNLRCTPAGRLAGPLVVSMRPLPSDRLEEAAEITSAYGRAHGAPVHAGDPAELGIADLQTPEFGDPVDVRAGETPMFWACGVTPQVVARDARTPLLITHMPGHMFLTDLTDDALRGPSDAGWLTS
jgi:uncharacterized protein YcsI (UPF0317 family)